MSNCLKWQCTKKTVWISITFKKWRKINVQKLYKQTKVVSVIIIIICTDMITHKNKSLQYVIKHIYWLFIHVYKSFTGSFKAVYKCPHTKKTKYILLKYNFEVYVLYTSTPLHFRRNYCTFWTAFITTCVWLL